jgi:hypothetical protein
MIHKMKGLKIIISEDIIQFILEKYCLIDMLLYKNLVGVTSLLFGYVKTSNIIHMWL